MIEQEPERGTNLDVVAADTGQGPVAVVARRVVVQLEHQDEGSLATTIESVLAAMGPGATVVRGPSATGRLVVSLPADQPVHGGGDAERSELSAVALVNDSAVAVTALDGVRYAEADVVDRAQIVPNDTRYAQQWAPAKVNAEAAWDLQTGQSNVLIGIVDSGISMTGGLLDHDDLNQASRITLGTDFVDGGTPQDLNGHGTHVVGIAAATGNNAAGIAGMNWASPIYICRTLDATGNGSGADFADAVEEITDYAVAHNLKAVINYSGGGAASATKQAACQYASDHGMLVCAATGNDGAGPVIWPAAYASTITGVVAVGSTDSNDTVSSYSNVGPEVTVVAPGRDILSTLPTYAVTLSGTNYGTLSGTSMATPLVTGLAALMWSRHPSHTNAKIKQCLQDSAVKLGAGTFDNSWGHGRVDALAAVRCGDLIVLPSRLTCPSVLLVCPKTRLTCPSVITICATRLPTLCPKRTVLTCPTNLGCVTRITCPSALACPSAVDGCPSALGCPTNGFDPTGPITIPVINQLDQRIQNLEARFGGTEVTAGADEGWFFVDDDGNVHEV